MKYYRTTSHSKYDLNLRKTFWGRHFWARGYLAVSSGNITDKMIQKYIEDEETDSLPHGDIRLT